MTSWLTVCVYAAPPDDRRRATDGSHLIVRWLWSLPTPIAHRSSIAVRVLLRRRRGWYASTDCSTALPRAGGCRR